jgi:hypothetical protein
VLDQLALAGVSRDIGILEENFAVLRNTRAPARFLSTFCNNSVNRHSGESRNPEALVNGALHAQHLCLKVISRRTRPARVFHQGLLLMRRQEP